MGTAQAVPAVTPIEQRGYAHPEVLVSTDWVAQHLNDPKVRLVESNEDILLYDTGHIPGAVKVDWTTDLNDQLVRDYVDKSGLQALLQSRGINNDTTIVFYGDKNNWWATYALWVLQLFGIENVKILDGGRLRWVDEGRKLSTDAPSYPKGNITVGERNDERIRAFREDVLGHLKKKGQLVDVRSPEEYPRREDAHARVPAGGLPPRRPHSGGEEHPVGQGDRPRDAHLQVGGRSPEVVRGGQQPEEGPGDDRLLPDRRAVVAHLVRAHVSARVRQGAELRRVVDGVGERGAAAGGEAVGSANRIWTPTARIGTQGRRTEQAPESAA